MLKDKAVLIVEDDIFLALDLTGVVEDLDARVVGPVATVAEALRLLETEPIAAAVLDWEIADDGVTQIVMQLAERGIPVVIYAMSAPPPAVLKILPDAPVFRGPIQPKAVLARLIDEVARKAEIDPDFIA